MGDVEKRFADFVPVCALVKALRKEGMPGSHHKLVLVAQLELSGEIIQSLLLLL